MAHAAEASSAATQNTMRANRRVDTGPERALRSALHQRGLRFRKDLRLKLAESSARPDIVFTRAKVAVFVDGCFWHSCPEHGELPKSNRAFWERKLRRNVARDREDDRALVKSGWTVLRFFEHVPSEEAAEAVLDAIRRSPRLN